MVNHISLKTVSPIGGDRQEPPWELCYPGSAKFFSEIANFLLTFLYAHDIFNVRTRKGGSKMSPPLGRPYSEDSKHERLYIRVTAAEKQKIMEFCRDNGITLLELIRKGMDAEKE